MYKRERESVSQQSYKELFVDKSIFNSCKQFRLLIKITLDKGGKINSTNIENKVSRKFNSIKVFRKVDFQQNA